MYDDFNVIGKEWTITEVFSDNLENTNVTGATWEIRTGTTLLGTGGTLVASGMTATPVVTPTGRSGFGFTEFQIKVTGLNVSLPLPPAGQTYWLNVTPIGDLSGRSFDSAIANGIGINCMGTPCGNNQNAFFNSNFFGVTFGSTADQGQPWDFSMGINGIGVRWVTDTYRYHHRHDYTPGRRHLHQPPPPRPRPQPRLCLRLHQLLPQHHGNTNTNSRKPDAHSYSDRDAKSDAYPNGDCVATGQHLHAYASWGRP